MAPGGTAGQVLNKTSAVDYATAWTTPPTIPTTLPPTGAAGGDLSGTYPNPIVSKASSGLVVTGTVPATPVQIIKMAPSQIGEALRVTNSADGIVFQISQTGALQGGAMNMGGACTLNALTTNTTANITGVLTAGASGNSIVWGSRVVRGRLTAASGADDLRIMANLNQAGVQDDSAKPSWSVLLDVANDAYSIARRAPAGATATLLALNNTGKLTVAADPTAALDVATKQYVDAHVGGPPTGAASGSLAGSYPGPSIAPLAVGTAELAAGAVTNAKVTDVAYAKITGAPTSLPPSGSASGDLSGSFPSPQIAAGVIVDADVSATAAIQYTKLTGTPTSLPPTGAASGDLGGTYPGPTVAKLNGASVGTTTPLARGDLLVANATPALVRLARGTVNQVLQSDGTDVVWGPAPATGGPPTGAAGGDLSGSYPNPQIAAGTIVDADVSATAAIQYSKLTGTPTALPGPPTGAAGGSLAGTYPNPTLAATGVGAAVYGSVQKILQVTINAEGRITAITEIKPKAYWG